MTQTHEETAAPYGLAGLADLLTTPQPEGKSQGLVSKPITVRISGHASLILEAAAEKLNVPVATLLRRIAEAGIEQFRDELAARGVDVEPRLKANADGQPDLTGFEVE